MALVNIVESAFGFPVKATTSFGGLTVPGNTLGKHSSRNITNEGIVINLVMTKEMPQGGPRLLQGELLFVFKDTAAHASPTGGRIHRVLSFPAMNKFLLEDCRSTKRYQTSGDVLREWNFIGVVDNPDASSRRSPMTASRIGCASVFVSGGALSFNYWAGDFQDLLPGCPTDHKSLVNSKKLIHLWLLLVKVPVNNLSNGGSGGVTLLGKRKFAEVIESDECWQFVPFCTHDKTPPHYSHFISPGQYIGDYIYVGRSLDSRGNVQDGSAHKEIIKNEILSKTECLTPGRLPSVNIMLS